MPFLKHLSNSLQAYFDVVVAVCSKHLPRNIVDEYDFVPFFDFYYDDFLKIDRERPRSLRHIPAEASLHFVDELERIATEDFQALIKDYEINEGDCILLPGSDFYAVLGVFNATGDLSKDARPRIFLRFMNISEHASKTYREPIRELARRLATAREGGTRVFCGAETPRYADHLAELFGMVVSVVPYVSAREPSSMPVGGPFKFFCGGGARADKGFFELSELFSRTRRLDPDLSIQFVAQSLPDRAGRDFEHYVSQLYAIPGVEILPSWISEHEIWAQYHRCNAVLLPYDRQTYLYRGSAVMMAAACVGRPALTLSGTAFAPVVSYYGLGEVVDNTDEMVDAIFRMATTSRLELGSRTLQARHRFITDVSAALSSWFRRES